MFKHFSFLERILFVVLIIVTSVVLTATYSYAQPTENPFQTIITLFDVDQNTGDVITFVNSENITKWKIFTPFNELRFGSTAEVKLAFNESSVNAGDKFKACILMIKEISIVCKNGENSIAGRPEIVDISVTEAKKINAEATGENTQANSTSNILAVKPPL